MPSRLLTTVRSLSDRKARERSGLAILEGVRLIEDALDAGVELQGYLTVASRPSPRLARLIGRLAAVAPGEEVDQRTMDEVADTDSPQGVLAVARLAPMDLDGLRPRRDAPALVLDGVQDPGNVGTMIRTAHALGACGVVLLDGTADLRSPKTLRATMGAAFRIPVARATAETLAGWVAEQRTTLWIGAADGQPVMRMAVPDRLALVVGNEGAGVSAAVRGIAGTTRVAIPLATGSESLNVAVAAGILLYEVVRRD